MLRTLLARTHLDELLETKPQRGGVVTVQQASSVEQALRVISEPQVPVLIAGTCEGSQEATKLCQRLEQDRTRSPNRSCFLPSRHRPASAT